MRKLVWAVLLVFIAGPALAFFHRACPTADDLNGGIIYTDPARVGAFDVAYRRLQGPLIGRVTRGSPFPGRQTITYAGLFVYRSWAEGVLRQWEEPQMDMSGILTFAPGTAHDFDFIRYGLRGGEVHAWRTVGTYTFAAAPDFALGRCSYRAIEVVRTGTLTMPDGSAKPDSQRFTYLPDLMLRVAGTGVYYGPLTGVRRPGLLDDASWPFTPDAADILDAKP